MTALAREYKEKHASWERLLVSSIRLFSPSFLNNRFVLGLSRLSCCSSLPFLYCSSSISQCTTRIILFACKRTNAEPGGPQSVLLTSLSLYSHPLPLWCVSFHSSSLLRGVTRHLNAVGRTRDICPRSKINWHCRRYRGLPSLHAFSPLACQ